MLHIQQPECLWAAEVALTCGRDVNEGRRGGQMRLLFRGRLLLGVTCLGSWNARRPFPLEVWVVFAWGLILGLTS